ncbi:hypothetical protein H9Q69_004050 [Fusarium xylarioides]|uniref:Uncharacterized protein n=1 Tax=Fusarium xylarioides TaxID=221167 RepID=A0A9P7HWM8_9HYPO|nr:hypothetical protein H9Q70_010680 [Fusarium xylarioides]KAG5766912.1 hypothetical protein H9Q72_005020 [Fusarium xylarioides]KAG5775879.1 hypothetical protein H9Q73_010451 [Fusarium xylarioides]KAG5796935.1 hypothetical protein H9Q69_004050 [Fusarium xylarioides]KAG5811134.1 hypothetical protein H9Q71_005066 [Fusarium xylarioides]
MCQEVVQQCCHCGDNIGVYIAPCHSWYVEAQVAHRERRAITPAWLCKYGIKQFQPMLTGCPNNDICLSWFGNIVPGFGNTQNESPEIKLFREYVAHEKLEEWEDQFAREYFQKKPIPPRKKPEGFMSLIRQDMMGDLESVTSFDSLESADTGSDYGEGSNQHGNEDSYDADSENSTQEHEISNDAAINKTSEVDPEDLFYGDVPDRTRDVEPKPSRVYNEPAVSIMNLFLSMMDLGRDGDFVE